MVDVEIHVTDAAIGLTHASTLKEMWTKHCALVFKQWGTKKQIGRHNPLFFLTQNGGGSAIFFVVAIRRG